MTNLEEMGQRAVTAKYLLQKASTEEKNNALQKAANALLENKENILAANEKDIERAEQNGMHPGMVDRLRLTPERIGAMAEGLLQIMELPDCVGEVL